MSKLAELKALLDDDRYALWYNFPWLRPLFDALAAEFEALERKVNAEKYWCALCGTFNDNHASGGCPLFQAEQQVERLTAELAAAKAELARLKNGEWTPEEFQNICHNLHGTVTVEEFAEGCRQEMIKLYGQCPVDQLKAELAEAVRSNERQHSFLKEIFALFPRTRFHSTTNNMVNQVRKDVQNMNDAMQSRENRKDTEGGGGE